MSVRYFRIFVAGAVIAVCQASLPAQEGTNRAARAQAETARTASGQQTEQGQHQELQSIIAKKLMMANQAEVELGKLALEKSQSEPVKKFAQMMVTEHQQLNEKLAKFAGAHEQGADSYKADAASDRVRGTTTDQANRKPNDRGTDASTAAQGQPGDGKAHAGGQATLAQLMQLGKKAAETELKMTKQLLQEYQGQDFDMGYLGQQTIAHTAMLAHLQACGQTGSQEFQQLIRQAEQATQAHLEQVKQLAQRREDDRTQPRASGVQNDRTEAGSSPRGDASGRTQIGSRAQPGNTDSPRTQPNDSNAPK